MIGASSSLEGVVVPVVHECAKEGCAILTMGELCLLHESEETELTAALLAAAAEAAEAGTSGAPPT